VAKFYFHLRDGVDILIDEEGRQLDSVEAVTDVALREARSIISCDAIEGHIRLDLRIDVEDASGVVVHSLAFMEAIVIVPAHNDA
jgi:hypothetical protein